MVDRAKKCKSIFATKTQIRDNLHNFLVPSKDQIQKEANKKFSKSRDQNRERRAESAWTSHNKLTALNPSQKIDLMHHYNDHLKAEKLTRNEIIRKKSNEGRLTNVKYQQLKSQLSSSANL